ncbi:MAG: hypothetical protein KAH25_11265, partial [Bacteroidales bacterium]|nr:hypothetical protein [Bacteroidales bacterium]
VRIFSWAQITKALTIIVSAFVHLILIPVYLFAGKKTIALSIQKRNNSKASVHIIRIPFQLYLQQHFFVLYFKHNGKQ